MLMDGKLNRQTFYEAAENLVGYGFNFAEVRNDALIEQKRARSGEKPLDTVVATKQVNKYTIFK